jgi:hypothetical protein
MVVLLLRRFSRFHDTPHDIPPLALELLHVTPRLLSTGDRLIKPILPASPHPITHTHAPLLRLEIRFVHVLSYFIPNTFLRSQSRSPRLPLPSSETNNLLTPAKGQKG